jgi:hypothetical protein
MPKEIAVLPVGPGSKSRSTDAAPKFADLGPLNTAVRRGPNRQTSNIDDRTKAARSKLDAVASEMATGKITDRETRIEPAAEVVTPPSVDATAKADAPAPAPETAKSEPKADKPKAEDATEKVKKLSAAKRALALDGWKPERIAKLDEDEILEIGSHRAKNQADVNREFAKLRNAASSPTGARNADGTFAEPAKPATDAPAKSDKDAKPAAAPTGDPEIDAMIDAAQDDIGEPAVKLLKAITTKMAAKMATGAKGSNETAEAVTTELLYSAGREAVEREYPEEMAKTPELFDEVAENFKALVSSGRYGRGQISKAWRDAAFMAFGAPNVTRKAQRDMLARQAAADVGRVDPGTGDKGAPTDAPITNHRDALKLAGQMMAANPNADPAKLQAQLMAKIRGNR